MTSPTRLAASQRNLIQVPPLIGRVYHVTAEGRLDRGIGFAASAGDTIQAEIGRGRTVAGQFVLKDSDTQPDWSTFRLLC